MKPEASLLLRLYEGCADFGYLSVRWHTQASRKQARYLESHHLTIGVSTTSIPPKPGIAYLLCHK